MSQQELRDKDGELLSVTEGLRTVARHMIIVCDDRLSELKEEKDQYGEEDAADFDERIRHYELLKAETEKALAIASEPLDWTKCPDCGADLNECGQYDSVDIEEGDAWQRANCMECEAEWGEWYRADERVIYRHGKKHEPKE